VAVYGVTDVPILNRGKIYSFMLQKCVEKSQNKQKEVMVMVQHLKDNRRLLVDLKSFYLLKNKLSSIRLLFIKQFHWNRNGNNELYKSKLKVYLAIKSKLKERFIQINIKTGVWWISEFEILIPGWIFYLDVPLIK